jgi:hypothetical protein
MTWSGVLVRCPKSKWKVLWERWRGEMKTTHMFFGSRGSEKNSARANDYWGHVLPSPTSMSRFCMICSSPRAVRGMSVRPVYGIKSGSRRHPGADDLTCLLRRDLNGYIQARVYNWPIESPLSFTWTRHQRENNIRMCHSYHDGWGINEELHATYLHGNSDDFRKLRSTRRRPGRDNGPGIIAKFVTQTETSSRCYLEVVTDNVRWMSVIHY